jgi:LPXTG-motif cell wall-anchored protein
MCNCNGNKMSHCSGCNGTCGGDKRDILTRKQFAGNDNGYNMDYYNSIIGLNGNGRHGIPFGPPDKLYTMSHFDDPEMVVDPVTQAQVDAIPTKPSTYDKVKSWFDDGTADKAAGTGLSVLSWLKTGQTPATRTPTAGSSGGNTTDTGTDYTLYYVAGGVMLLILGIGLYFAFRKK